MKRIYLDHQSATPVLPEVAAAMQSWLTEVCGSAASLHSYGVKARDALSNARGQVAGLLSAAAPEDIIFTADGTEAVNLAIKGTAWANQARGKHLVVSATEHLAVLNAVNFLERQGFTCTRVSVDKQGLINPADIRAALTDETILVAVHHANHDLGTLQPICEIADLTTERGVTLFVDAEASVGWLPMDVQALGVSLLSFSANRLGGPLGAGVLYRHRRARLEPLLHGGKQEGGLRAGAENLPAIIGAGVAATIAKEQMEARAQRAVALQRKLWQGIREQIPYVKLNGPEPGAGRVPHSLNVSVEFVEGEGLLLKCDMLGLAAAAGTSCLGKSMKVPHVLAAIGLEPSLAQASLLFSLGFTTTEAEIDDAVSILAKATERMRSMSPTWEEFESGRIGSATMLDNLL